MSSFSRNPQNRTRSRRLGLECLEKRSMLVAGSLDFTFASGGVTTDPFLGTFMSAVAVDKQNRIVGAGVGADGDFRVTRFENDGTTSGVSVSFGNSGSGYAGFVAAFAIDGKGRGIIACGIPSAAGHDVAVARLLPDGTLDQTFGQNGTVVGRFFQGNMIEDMAIDSKGRIILVGPVDAGGSTDYGVTRLTVNGALDGAFGDGGNVRIAFDEGGRRNDWATCVTVDRKDRIIVGGNVDISDHGGFSYWDRDFGVARLTARGRLDTTFAGEGTKLISFDRGGEFNDVVADVAVDGRGRIVIVGTVQNGSTGTTTDDYGIARLTSSGSLDQAFGTDGKMVVAFNLSGDNEDVAKSVRIDQRGRIIVAGNVSRSDGDIDFGVARLTARGRLDVAFGRAGLTTVAIDRGGSLADRVSDLVIDRKGRFVISGGSAVSYGEYGNNVYTAAVVRMLG